MGRIGGNLRTLSYILERLDRTQFEPVVMAPMDTEFLQGLQKAGTEVLVVEPGSAAHRYGGKALRDGLLGRFRTISDVVGYNLRVWRMMRKNPFDVVYANSIRALLFVFIATLLTRTPLLWYIKGELNNPWLDRLGFAVSDRILFFCEANRDDKYPDLVRRYRNKIQILRIGLDLAVIDEARRRDPAPLREDIGFETDWINTVVLGQVYRPKGQDLAIRALAQLVEAHPRVRLFIVGDPVLEEYAPYLDELRGLVRDLGLDDHVRFTGWRTDALAILATTDIMLHPSLSEGFGRAVLEAMALGRPVVASRVGGLREIITDGENGFLITPGDVDALADRWRRLIESPDLRDQFSRNAEAIVRAEYRLEDKIDQLAAIWADMGGARRVRHRR
jgi:glycosyltransferase involved in cell wall biosynthesis